MIARRFLLCLITALAMHTWPAHADALSDAFNQGTTLGRSGNAAARGQISGTTAQATVPNYTTAPPEASYFGSPGLGTLSSTHVSACTGASGQTANFAQQGCNAVDFSQTNPSRRPTYSIGPNDPLLTRAKTITADPQAIAGNLAGTYSGCSVQTVTRPDIFETAICHQYPAMEQASCQKLLTVQVAWSNSCTPGTWFGNFWVNTWGNGEVGRRYAGIVINAQCQTSGTVRMAFYAICTESPCSGSADIQVDPTSGATSPQTFTNFIGRSWYASDLFNRVDYNGGGCTADQCSFAFCTRYESEYSSCDEYMSCTTYPINETRACGTFTFERPRSVATVTDAWDNQCASFEARLP
ncbi:MAG: conjugal transfer mating pair stabilization protein TraN [Rhodocyclaceae bacterium]|nr:MAG: conjugal transfer mating pair stabilization protein TraN [Rhodocyclaceae bacterium]TND02728.1 MAG: conjugal transfer mating pair stabilization protein TraN [Rhodocyclaceae bacterium]